MLTVLYDFFFSIWAGTVLKLSDLLWATGSNKVILNCDILWFRRNVQAEAWLL